MITERAILSRMAVIFVAAGLPLVLALYQFRLRDATSDAPENRVISIRASAPESGGFDPTAIRVPLGKAVTLRFTSTDITHGVAIGSGMNIEVGEIARGESKEITLTFDKTGTYTFYNNVWSSPDTWRMRGIIEVYNPSNPNALPLPVQDEVIENLVAEGVNIDDATHMGDYIPALPVTFSGTPSAARGQQLMNSVVVPEEILSAAWRQTNPPLEALELLQQANPEIAVEDLADVVAHLWTENEVSPATIEFYNKNCAACHGIQGLSEGRAAEFTAERPIAFANLAHMFTRRNDVLYAKIRRGGMGTDMPNFGTILTPDETWALVDYLWVLAFQE